MITLYGFRRIFPAGVGETKDLRIEWALQETGLPYRVHGLDHTAGDLDDPEFVKLSPFHQAPVVDDDGLVIAESGAILLYIAKKSGKLMPADAAGRARVTQWCFAAVSTVAPTLSLLGFGDMAGLTDEGAKFWRQIAKRWLDGLEASLTDRDWIAGDDFTIADILMASVLREVRHTDLLAPYPRLRDYFARALARPAWRRTLELYAERMGVEADSIR